MKRNHKQSHPLRTAIRILLVAIVLIGLCPVVAHNPFYKQRLSRQYDHYLSVMTYNTHRMGEFKKPDSNTVLQYLETVDADIVCLEEVDVYKDKRYLTLNELKHAMQAWPYTYFDFKVYNSHRQFGNVVFSRYPLTDKHTIPFDSRASISSCCHVIVDGDTLCLIINHLESNRLDPSDMDSLAAKLTDQHSNLNHKLAAAAAIRHDQARAVRREVYRSEYPVIVAGDINDIPHSFTYRHLSQGLRDCFLETNFMKIGNTFPLPIFGVRIDYILCDKRLTPLTTKVVQTKGSDHYPVLSTIAW